VEIGEDGEFVIQGTSEGRSEDGERREEDGERRFFHFRLGEKKGIRD
jgi:hypothetical protein